MDPRNRTAFKRKEILIRAAVKRSLEDLTLSKRRPSQTDTDYTVHECEVLSAFGLADAAHGGVCTAVWMHSRLLSCAN